MTCTADVVLRHGINNIGHVQEVVCLVVQMAEIIAEKIRILIGS